MVVVVVVCGGGSMYYVKQVPLHATLQTTTSFCLYICYYYVSM